MATHLPAATKNNMIKGGFSTATTWHWGLNTTTMGTTGAHEVTGGSYARQTSKLGAPATGQMSTASKLTYTSMPAVTVTQFSIWATPTAGTYEGGGALTASLTVPSGSTVSVAVGGFKVKVTG